AHETRSKPSFRNAGRSRPPQTTHVCSSASTHAALLTEVRRSSANLLVNAGDVDAEHPDHRQVDRAEKREREDERDVSRRYRLAGDPRHEDEDEIRHAQENRHRSEDERGAERDVREVEEGSAEE